MTTNICSVCSKEKQPMFVAFALEDESWRVCLDCVVEKLGAPRGLLEKCMETFHTMAQNTQQLGERLVKLSEQI